MSKNYRLFLIAKYRLSQYGIEVENISQFVNCIVGIAKENYDVTKVLEKIGDYDNLVYYLQLYKNEAEAKKNELDKLNQDINYCKGLLDSYRIKLDIIEELERMDFGINELRILFNTLNEIGRENNKSLAEIKKEFFDDLKDHNEIIRSRKEIDRLKNELKNLEIQIIKEREKYNSYPQIIKSIDRLSNAGIHEDDILAIDKIISMTGIHLYKDKPMYKQTLFDDLQKYGNLKLAIKNLKGRKIYLKPKKKTKSKQGNNHHRLSKMKSKEINSN